MKAITINLIVLKPRKILPAHSVDPDQTVPTGGSIVSVRQVILFF